MKLKKIKRSNSEDIYFVKGDIIYPLKFNKHLKEIHCKIEEDFNFGTEDKSYNVISKGDKIVFKKHITGDSWSLIGESKKGKIFTYLIRDEDSFNTFCKLSKVSF